MKFNLFYSLLPLSLAFSLSSPHIGLAEGLIEEKMDEVWNAKKYVLDISETCSRGVAEEKASIGTRILGVSISDSLCSVVSELEGRGFDCQEDFFDGGAPFAQLPPPQRSLPIKEQIYCSKDDAMIFLAPGGEALFHTKDMDPGTSNENFILAVAEIQLKSPLISIVFECAALGACTSTGVEMAQYIVDNISSVKEFKQVGDQLNGFTEFGDNVIVTNASSASPSVVLKRGAIDSYSAGGISLD